MDAREIEALLAEMAEDEEPLRPGLRDAILASAAMPARTPAPRRAWRLVWGAPAAAALCGLWLGAAQPALVLGGTGLGPAPEVALLDAALGGWEDWP
jgi:hypothetical protein